VARLVGGEEAGKRQHRNGGREEREFQFGAFAAMVPLQRDRDARLQSRREVGDAPRDAIAQRAIGQRLAVERIDGDGIGARGGLRGQNVQYGHVRPPAARRGVRGSS
jgi:hypothetical protein